MLTARLSLEMVPVVPLFRTPEPAPFRKSTPLKPPEILPELLIVVFAEVSIADALSEVITPPVPLSIVTPAAPFDIVIALTGPCCNHVPESPVTVTVSPVSGSV